MSRKSEFEVIQRDGWSKRTTVEADSLEELMKKLEEKTGWQDYE